MTYGRELSRVIAGAADYSNFILNYWAKRGSTIKTRVAGIEG